MANIETLHINGITYEVVSVTTPDSAEAAGHVGVAQMMRQDGKTRMLGLKRPKGSVQYFVVEWANKYKPGSVVYGEVVSLGR